MNLALSYFDQNSQTVCPFWYLSKGRFTLYKGESENDVIG